MELQNIGITGKHLLLDELLMDIKGYASINRHSGLNIIIQNKGNLISLLVNGKLHKTLEVKEDLNERDMYYLKNSISYILDDSVNGTYLNEISFM